MPEDYRDVITHYRNPDVVDRYQEDRYGGRVGEWFLAFEQSVFRRMAENLGEIGTVLDIGTGTGKLRSSVHADSFVGLDSSFRMLRISLEMWGDVPLVMADSVELPFLSNSIDLVAASRVIMHVPDWSQMIREACRVARRAVLLDYPSRPSVAALEPTVWRWTRGRNAPPAHRIFAQSEIDEVFASLGFECTTIRKGYFLPYRLYRVLRSPGLSARIEGAFYRTGLTKRYGSPTFALYRPADKQ